jgi:hypothetical protein
MFRLSLFRQLTRLRCRGSPGLDEFLEDEYERIRDYAWYGSASAISSFAWRATIARAALS